MIEAPRTEEEIKRWAAAAHQDAQRHLEVQQRVAAVTITGASRDGLVRVTVDATGAVRDLEISDRVRDLSGTAVASAVLSTMRRAQARIAGQVGEIAQRSGVDGAALVSSYRQRFPEPPPESSWAPRHTTAPPPRRQEPVQDDDDWDYPAVTE